MKTRSIDKQQLIAGIESTYSDLKAALSRFSEETLNTVPFEDSWTAGQVAEHIIKSNGGILNQLLNGKTEIPNRPYDEHVTLMQEIFRNRAEKAKSAAALEPGPPSHALNNLLDILEDHREQQIETANTKDLTMLSTELEFPAGVGRMTRYEWIHMMIEHTQRHRHQIEDIGRKIN